MSGTNSARVPLRERIRLLEANTIGKLGVYGFGASWLRHFPDTKRLGGFPEPWPMPNAETPEQLRTVAGNLRDEEGEERAYAEGPPYSFNALHGDAGYRIVKHLWPSLVPSLPRMHRIEATIKDVLADQPTNSPPAADPQSLTDEVRAEAERIGLSQVGFAPYDPKYTFAEALTPQPDDLPLAPARVEPLDQGSVIVCILEQDWEVTQAIPSAKAEREVFRTYEALVEKASQLARLLHRKGFRADVHGPSGMAISIHYAVEAGLGQLGLNGQLLTPRAGSRCRLTLITTNAQFAHGEAVDYGVHPICDACQACVRRCPPGAIPRKREYHRGVLKAKIKPDRCFPILAQVHGCGICMKVCPIQRYGLDAVKEHFVETGEILGKGTDELEGYHWIDGRHYGPGQKPRMTEELLHPDGVVIDRTRKVPPGVEPPAPAEEPAASATISPS